ncbi:uncharacterized protein LOC135975666 [Chrysemys picta bellii]|uniref:uncharacterized protein LOC135975666 n=1 Tax=Chrysemys picta bellii TaxID=8478 RepID=UPI0032B1EE84
MTTSETANQLELARLEATEKENEHKRRMELKQLEINAEKAREEAAHERAMEQKEKEMEERERERKHELEVARARPDIPANPSNPSPGTTSHPRKFPTYKAGDDTEAFLEHFERACLGYSITPDQYMVELRPQVSGPLAEVAAEMPKEHMNSYELFNNKARIRMGLTPEHARRRFRALRWNPDVSFTRHAYHIGKNWEAWISGANVKSTEELPFLMQMEQFLEGAPEEIERFILDGKPKTVTKAGEIGAKWVEVAEKKKKLVAVGANIKRGKPKHYLTTRDNPRPHLHPKGNPRCLLTPPHQPPPTNIAPVIP